MKGDFSRNTFDPAKHFSRVLMQQGRVQLDADWNEQVSILLHYLQILAADLIGHYGGPANDLGFKITPSDGSDFGIGPGRYYVDGILCENGTQLDENGNPLLTYTGQTGYPFLDSVEADELKTGKHYLAYLDVWERHITYVEDEDEHGDEPSIREVALGGPDTATRAQVVCQVKVTDTLPDGDTTISDTTTVDKVQEDWDANGWTRVNKWQPANRGQLKAMAKRDPDSATDPCTASPDARYDRPENQLYRVEIHKPGRVGEAGKAGKATFKWSRENGSVVFPIVHIATDSAPQPTTTITLEHLGRDEKLSLAAGDWVEVVNDEYVLHNCVDSLLKVLAVNHEETTVTLNGTSTVSDDADKHPILRRWDHKAGGEQQGEADLGEGVPIIEGQTKEGGWLKLEHGIEIQFQPPDDGETQYRTGDYWLIPARTATEDVEWPGPKGDPQAVSPHGVEHHYALLWIISVDETGAVTAAADDDCRCSFSPLCAPTP